MGQHLGSNKRSNVLRRRLTSISIDPEKCRFRLIAYGPISEEASTQNEHRALRDTVAALEKALADAMSAAGYPIINPVHSRKPVNAEMFAVVQTSFAIHFPMLRDASATEQP
jgi:hypothetical protein